MPVVSLYLELQRWNLEYSLVIVPPWETSFFFKVNIFIKIHVNSARTVQVDLQSIQHRDYFEHLLIFRQFAKVSCFLQELFRCGGFIEIIRMDRILFS